jgi:hypothetical protein
MNLAPLSKSTSQPSMNPSQNAQALKSFTNRLLLSHVLPDPRNSYSTLSRPTPSDSPVHTPTPNRFFNAQIEAAMGDFRRYQVHYCTVCNISYYNNALTKMVKLCPRCSQLESKKLPNFFAKEFNPGPTPSELHEFKLSFVEEQLIAAVTINQYIYLRKSGQNYSTKGHSISFPQDIPSFASQLPRLPAECNIIIIRRPNQQPCGNSPDLRVRRKHVQVWLEYLKANHSSREYREMNISKERLALLPEDGFIELPEIIASDDFVTEIATHRDNFENIINPERANQERDKKGEKQDETEFDGYIDSDHEGDDSGSSDSYNDGSDLSEEDNVLVSSKKKNGLDGNPGVTTGVCMPRAYVQTEDTTTLNFLNNIIKNKHVTDSGL